MKQSLLLTALLAGAAMADTPVLGGSMDESAYVTYSSLMTIGNGGVITATSSHGGTQVSVSPPTFTCNDAAYVGDSNTIGVDVGAGGSFTASYHFPVNTSTLEAYTINNITFTFGLNNDEGTPYPLGSYIENNGSNPQFELTMVVKNHNGDVVATRTKVHTYSIEDETAIYATGFGFTTEENPELQLQDDFTLDITVKGIDANVTEDSSFYVSVNQIQLMGKAPKDVVFVPEPTTATLSLLALAGLAARRRRK